MVQGLCDPGDTFPGFSAKKFVRNGLVIIGGVRVTSIVLRIKTFIKKFHSQILCQMGWTAGMAPGRVITIFHLLNEVVLCKKVKASNIVTVCSSSLLQTVPATVDGMLGGFGQLSSTDAASSRRFIQPFMKVHLI